ncbi:RloB family protein [Aeromonas caviae]
MGSDDLFHKKKAKKAKELARKKSKRESYDRVLIVCEGEKTEPNYFNELIRSYKLSSANVAVDGTSGSSPISVFRRANELYESERVKNIPFDKVYCVFDKDSHESYQETLDAISRKTPKNIFYACTSVPCFEFWLLLHYGYRQAPFHKTGNKSIGDKVVDELKTYIPNYEKGMKDIFITLESSLDDAIGYSKAIQKQALSTGSDNPSTQIHELVIYLRSLKSTKGP